MKFRGSFSKRLLIGVFAGVALAIAGLSAVVADTISVGQARNLLQHLGGANWSKNQVQIRDISAGVGAGGVVVEAQIETAFRLAKEKGNWRVTEIRLGDRQWESFELIEEAVRREKIRRTSALLTQMADALSAYQKAHGQFIEADKVTPLLDQLAPQYLTTVQRFDLWGEELKYHGSGASYRLSSDGPDRKSGTKDDLVMENGALKASLE